MVFQRSLLTWRRGWGQSAMGIYALLYIEICQVWCSSIKGIYAQLMGDPSTMGICALFYIYIDLP